MNPPLHLAEKEISSNYWKKQFMKTFMQDDTQIKKPPVEWIISQVWRSHAWVTAIMQKTRGRILSYSCHVPSAFYPSYLFFSFFSQFQAVQNHLFGIFFIVPAAYSWWYLIGLGGCRRWGCAGPLILLEIKCFLCNILKSYFILHQFKMEWFSPLPSFPTFSYVWRVVCHLEKQHVGTRWERWERKAFRSRSVVLGESKL